MGLKAPVEVFVRVEASSMGSARSLLSLASDVGSEPRLGAPGSHQEIYSIRLRMQVLRSFLALALWEMVASTNAM